MTETSTSEVTARTHDRWAQRTPHWGCGWRRSHPKLLPRGWYSPPGSEDGGYRVLLQRTGDTQDPPPRVPTLSLCAALCGLTSSAPPSAFSCSFAFFVAASSSELGGGVCRTLEVTMPSTTPSALSIIPPELPPCTAALDCSMEGLRARCLLRSSRCLLRSAEERTWRRARPPWRGCRRRETAAAA